MIFFWRGGVGDIKPYDTLFYFNQAKTMNKLEQLKENKTLHLHRLDRGAIKHGPILDILTNPYTCNLYDEKTDISL